MKFSDNVMKVAPERKLRLQSDFFFFYSNEIPNHQIPFFNRFLNIFYDYISLSLFLLISLSITFCDLFLDYLL